MYTALLRNKTPTDPSPRLREDVSHRARQLANDALGGWRTSVLLVRAAVLFEAGPRVACGQHLRQKFLFLLLGRECSVTVCYQSKESWLPDSAISIAFQNTEMRGETVARHLVCRFSVFGMSVFGTLIPNLVRLASILFIK